MFKTIKSVIVNRIWFPQLVVFIMLYGALYYEHYHSYYILLRWVCCAAFTYLATFAHFQKKTKLTWIMGTTSLIYNPIIPIPYSEGLCSIINLLTTVIIIPLSFLIKNSLYEKVEPIVTDET